MTLSLISGNPANEGERLMKVVGDAVGQFFADKNGMVEGKPTIDALMALDVFAALAGAILFHSPTHNRKDATDMTMSKLASHAGYSAQIKLRAHS